MDRATIQFGLLAAGMLFLTRRKRSKPKHIVDLVRESCKEIAIQLGHLVHIEPEQVAKVAKGELLAKPPQWDEHDWHCCTSVHGDDLTARYVFALDALNYCFWPTREATGLEYEHLARGLRKACDKGDRLLDLENCTEERLKGWLEAPHQFPLLETRLEAIRLLGKAFKKHGDALEWVKESKNSAAHLVDLVVARLTSFKDQTEWNGRTVYLYKRAQILVADMWAAFGQKKGGLGGFNDIDKLTMFADYRVPQLLRDLGVLVYSPDLARKIDNLETIPRDSTEEIALRAATVHAVELIREANNGRLTSVEVDWILWQKGEALKSKLKPHHRTLTTCY